MSCPVCGYTLRDVNRAKAYCENCGRSFYLCSRCGAVFATPQALASHMRSHKPRRDLVARVEELEREVKELRVRVEALEKLLQQQEKVASAPSAPAPSAPDWLVNNPWLRVLSEREGG